MEEDIKVVLNGTEYSSEFLKNNKTEGEVIIQDFISEFLPHELMEERGEDILNGLSLIAGAGFQKALSMIMEG